MQRALSSLLSLSLLSALAAQNCPDPVTGNVLGVGDEVMFPIQSIGFTFPFAGATYTDIHVSTNGFVTLSNGGTPAPGGSDYTATTAEFSTGAPRIAPLWNDLDIRADNNGQVLIANTPTKCTVTWRNAQNYNAGTGGGTRFDVQLELLPTGDIRFNYSPNVTNNSSLAAGQPAIVGVSPGGGVTLPAATDLGVGGASLDDATFELFATANTFDMPNLQLQLFPTSPGYVFVPGVPANCAASTDYGVGCVERLDSAYEFFANGAAFDLGSRTISMIWTGASYLVLDGGTGAIVAPSGTATMIANGDDVTATVTLSAAMPSIAGPVSDLVVCSNGFITFGSTGNGADYTPTAAEFLAWANAAIAVSWHDYNPTLTGSGKIWFEEIGGVAYVTWDNVYTHTTTIPHRFQAQYDVATGNVTIVYDTWTAAGNAHLVGVGQGGASPGVAAVDLSTALTASLTVFATAAPAAKLTTNSKPYLGNAGFAWDATQVPTLLPLAFLFIGDTIINPGVDLGFIGMPGCNAYSNGNLLNLSFPTPGGNGSVPLAIPNNPAIAGAVLTSQVVALSLDTPANLVVSNGNAVVVGY